MEPHTEISDFFRVSEALQIVDPVVDPLTYATLSTRPESLPRHAGLCRQRQDPTVAYASGNLKIFQKFSHTT